MRNLAIAMAAALGAATTFAADAKLTSHPVELENPGFEAAASGWSLPRNAAIDASVAHGGAASVSLTVEDPDTDGVYITRNVPVEAGATYVVSCYVKTESVTEVSSKRESVGAGLIVEWTDRDGKWISGGEYACNRYGTRDWELAECKTLRAPDNAGFAMVCLALRDKGKAWFDDFAFTAMETEVDLLEPAADAKIACNTPRFAWGEMPKTDRYTVDISQNKAFPANARSRTRS